MLLVNHWLDHFRSRVSDSAAVNAYDVLCNDWIVFSQDSLPAALGTAEARPVAAKKAAAKKAAAPKAPAPKPEAEAEAVADPEPESEEGAETDEEAGDEGVDDG